MCRLYTVVMSERFRMTGAKALSVALLLGASVAAAPAFGQGRGVDRGGDRAGEWVHPPALSKPDTTAPNNKSDNQSKNSSRNSARDKSAAEEADRKKQAERAKQRNNLEFLFGALKVAPDDASAKAVEDRIWRVWMRSGGDATDLLMSRVSAAVASKDLPLAHKLLDAIIAFKPDYVEGWDRRATLYYMQKDYGHAVADIAQVLAREPRHFGALFGLGLIMQEFGEDARALQAFRKAAAVHPHLKKLPELIKTLSQKIDGRDI